jgi:hypothetical protein
MRHYAWLPVGPFAWRSKWLKVCVSSPPVPVSAPVRESSPGGAYGTKDREFSETEGLLLGTHGFSLVGV